MAESLVTLLIAGVIGLVVFLLIRGIVLWYFKIDSMNDTLIKIRDLLEQNAELSKRPPGSPANASPSPQPGTTPPPERKSGLLSRWRSAGGMKGDNDD